MKTFLLITLILVFTSTKAQNDSVNKKNITNFNKQGEQEDYWAMKLFEEKYEKQSFDTYKGIVSVVNENTFKYADNILEIFNTEENLKAIFKLGIFYPGVLAGKQKGESLNVKPKPDSMTSTQTNFYNLTRSDSLSFSKVEEVKFLSKSPKIKRFRFWLYNKGVTNPTVCFFELTNEKANEKTDMESFIRDAKLTFFKEGWIVI